ncbi:MAG: protease complex subunit PrcB family protein, partial [Gammaproteobacteria bacterium]|nr:protease complex subunit PrcB family protein [Gammaproteobacteria bacterium]
DNLAAAEVLKHGNCQMLESGISQVSFADVAKIRGSKLIGMTELKQPQQEPDLLLLAVSNGAQPTPGYGFSLKDAYLDAETAVIEFSWKEPEADAVLPQVMTHPCIIVGLGTGSFQEVRAIDHTGKLIGELSL